MSKLFKTMKGRKVHLSYNDNTFVSRCGVHGNERNSYSVVDMISKHFLCKNCFKGMSPDNFDLKDCTFKR